MEMSSGVIVSVMHGHCPGRDGFCNFICRTDSAEFSEVCGSLETTLVMSRIFLFHSCSEFLSENFMKSDFHKFSIS